MGPRILHVCGTVEEKQVALVSAHAPHEFDKHEAKHVFWDTLAATCVKIMMDYGRNFWLCIDDNARTGSELSSAIGSAQPERQNTNGSKIQDHESADPLGLARR